MWSGIVDAHKNTFRCDVAQEWEVRCRGEHETFALSLVSLAMQRMCEKLSDGRKKASGCLQPRNFFPIHRIKSGANLIKRIFHSVTCFFICPSGALFFLPKQQPS